jgi:UDP-N-acetylbacillosamine N-acetyltransferase
MVHYKRDKKNMEQQKENILIYGAGGHAAVVISAAHKAGVSIAGIIDDVAHIGDMLLSHEIRGGRETLPEMAAETNLLHVAIGDNKVRAKVSAYCAEAGFQLKTLWHPHAVCEEESIIGDGTFIAVNAVVGTCTQIGKGCIINTAATVDHHCIIGEFTHICPGVHIAGTVTIGADTLVGTGACVIPGIKIGSRCVIGAGAVVVRDVPDDTQVMGIPARVR